MSGVRHSIESVAMLQDICDKHALHLTRQRLATFRALCALPTPSANEVWLQALNERPNLSRRTVYSILDVFNKIDIINKISHPVAVVRYQTCIPSRHHGFCTSCGSLRPLKGWHVAPIQLPGEECGFVIHDYAIQITGICSECSRQKKATSVNSC